MLAKFKDQLNVKDLDKQFKKPRETKQVAIDDYTAFYMRHDRQLYSSSEDEGGFGLELSSRIALKKVNNKSRTKKINYT